jgi:hypothetical protein
MTVELGRKPYTFGIAGRADPDKWCESVIESRGQGGAERKREGQEGFDE